MLRYTHYYRDSDMIDKLVFTRANYVEAGIPETPVYGMNESSALTLVNKWNNEVHRVKYWIDPKDGK